MPVRSRTSVLTRALVATTLVLGPLAVSPTAGARTTYAPGSACPTSTLRQPTRLATALDTRVSAAVVRELNALTSDQLHHLAQDGTAWLDACGRVFTVDEAASPEQRVVADATATDVPPDVLDLSSRPGARRTIYLDFDGDTRSGTRWRDGQQIVSPAYSIDSDAETLTEVERAQVHLAWQVVAEDFAPFDVDVTTRRPDPSALTRTDSADQTYGMHVVVTPTSSVADGCSCGGMAYVGVLGNPAANDAQPAWVFTRGAGTGGYNLGQVISHEVGHTFGLTHDGVTGSDYYAGAKGWGPIMGASYNRRASHWASGEYAGATNVEDDVAVVSRLAAVLPDDHADGVAGATPIVEDTDAAGLVGSRTDVDAFTFTASGPTTLAVAGPAGVSNLDARLRVVDGSGATVAVVDPVADWATDDSLAAVWRADLPATPSTYTVLVDGTGDGDPAEAGRYSDYGSVGSYTVTLSAGPAPTGPIGPTAPPTVTTAPAASSAPSTTLAGSAGAGGTATGRTSFVTTRLAPARVGRSYRAVIRFTGPVAEARVDRRLPHGLRWRVRGDRIVITGRVRSRTSVRFAAVLSADGASVRRQFRLRVR